VFNKIREIKLVIIGGERSYIKAIEKLISKLRLNRGVVLIPNASDEELDAAFNSSELVVIPSIYEPFGNVALEAMKFGKPIVASRVGGLSEILVDGRNSLLVKAGSTKQIEEAILKVLKNKKLAIRMGKNNKKDVKKFDRKKYVEVVNNFYKEILNLN
jgi:1,4-alpha-glucan branching enzyme